MQQIFHNKQTNETCYILFTFHRYFLKMYYFSYNVTTTSILCNKFLIQCITFFPGERLALTLRYIASGDSYKSLSYSFLIGHSTISKIVPQVCAAITDVYGHNIKLPNTQQQWKAVAQRYGSR